MNWWGEDRCHAGVFVLTRCAFDRWESRSLARPEKECGQNSRGRDWFGEERCISNMCACVINACVEMQGVGARLDARDIMAEEESVKTFVMPRSDPKCAGDAMQKTASEYSVCRDEPSSSSTENEIPWREKGRGTD